MSDHDSFPRQYARTQRFTLGEPRTFTVAPDGRHVLFLRSRAGDDAVTMLWLLDTVDGGERLLLDPRRTELDTSRAGTEAEVRRRERAREAATGVVGYTVDADFSTVVTVLAGRLLAVDISSGTHREIPVAPGIFDARPNRDASVIAYVRDGSLCLTDRDGNERTLAAAEGSVSWGQAEFVAAEEMGRQRGHWWSPDGRMIAACRVDDGPVGVWHVADPSRPDAPALAHRYPAAGTANASVGLWLFDVDGQSPPREVDLGDDWEYLTTVAWSGAGLIAQTQSRDQRQVTVRQIDPVRCTSEVLWHDEDPDWIELVPGVPCLADDGRLVTCSDRDGARRLMVDGSAVTPADLQVRAVVAVGTSVVFTANPIASPRQVNIWRCDLATATLTCIADGETVCSGAANGAGSTTVVRRSELATPRASFEVIRRDGQPSTATPPQDPEVPAARHALSNHAEEAMVVPNVSFHEVGKQRTQVAILLPRDGRNDKLPVLFNPYGGPHAQMVVDARNAHATSQWFADQGFCVVVADNRGTPGRGSRYERAVHGDLAGPVLEDQIEVARALPTLTDRADIDRVAIRGWSFGGYLAALAVLRAPDVFHCAVAGAPVTDWTLYDTHYTERYLGDPRVGEDSYRASSLIEDAHRLSRPLLLVHGLADDNVVVAHTLRLSSALLAAGCPHEVLPLAGVTHMTPDEVVAENLLLHQLSFIRRALGLDDGRVARGGRAGQR